MPPMPKPGEPEHIRLLRASLRRFVEQEMPRPAAAAWDRDNAFPRDVFARLAGAGMMALGMPEEYGGTGRDVRGLMTVIEELSRRSLAVAVPYIMCTCYAGLNLVESGSERQKAELLPKVVDGSLLFAYGWTEPDTGADLATVKTRAERRGDRIVVNGAKRFCSGAGIADYILTLANSDREGPRHKNLSFLLVPSQAPGVRIETIDCMGMKGAATTDVAFTDVAVPAENILGGPAAWNQAWPQLVGPGMNIEKLEVAAMALGIAEAATDDAWIYAQQRTQFGQRIAAFQSIRHKLAEMKTRLYASRLMLDHAARLAQAGLPCGVETSMAKLFVTEACKEVVLEAQTILGGYGYARESSVERHVRDILLMPIIGGSSAIQRNNIVNWLGLPKA
jgi:alkylation response protein AidB-like acyl-CoA dehydrogenase